MITQAHSDFKLAMGDADQLLKFYEEKRLAALPSVPENIEVLKRASLILTVTAWETYLEDLLKERFNPRLKKANSPKEVSRVFNIVAGKWLEQDKSKLHKSLESWTSWEWKIHIQNYFDATIKRLNTPGSAICSTLFKDFLEIDLRNYWKWSGNSFDRVCRRLDEVIAKRGLTTHVARKVIYDMPQKHALSRQELLKHIQFVRQLVVVTDKIFAQ